MSKAARSLAVFAAYLVILGVGLVLVPDVMMAPFGFPPVQDVWIRVVGMLTLVLASYYALAVRREWRDFFQLSVYVRASVMVFVGGFVVAGLGPKTLFVFGAIDLAGAAWTAMALRAAPSA